MSIYQTGIGMTFVMAKTIYVTVELCILPLFFVPLSPPPPEQSVGQARQNNLSGRRIDAKSGGVVARKNGD